MIRPQHEAIVVTSTVSPAYAWTLSVLPPPISPAAANSIPASGLGLTNGTLLNATGAGAYPGTVTFNNLPAHNPSPADTATNLGLGGTPQTLADSYCRRRHR